MMSYCCELYVIVFLSFFFVGVISVSRRVHAQPKPGGDEKASVYYVSRGAIWHEGAAAIR